MGGDEVKKGLPQWDYAPPNAVAAVRNPSGMWYWALREPPVRNGVNTWFCPGGWRCANTTTEDAKPDYIYRPGSVYVEVETDYKFNRVDVLMKAVAKNDLKEKDAGQHYRHCMTVGVTQEDLERGYITIKLDPFRIADIYEMNSFALQTVLKKCLKAGERGHKDKRQDLLDIICAANRELEIMDEDGRNQVLIEAATDGV